MTLLITVFAAVFATVKWYTRKDDSMKLGIFSDQIEKANTKFDGADETKKCIPLFQKKKRERENKLFYF